MHFTSLILATSLAISANGAALLGLGPKADASNSISFEPTGTGFSDHPKPTTFSKVTRTKSPHSITTKIPHPTVAGSAHFTFPAGTGAHVPLPKTSKASDSGDSKTKGVAKPTATFEAHVPSGSGGFAHPSGGRARSDGHAQPSGHAHPTKVAHTTGTGEFGGHGGARPTGAFGTGSSRNDAKPTGKSFPAVRRGFFF